MATQPSTEVKRARAREAPSRDDGRTGEAVQGDTWKALVDTLSQQFGEALDPVLAELPQRMAKAIEANLTKDGEQVARFLPEDPGESGASRDDPRNARTDADTTRRGEDGTDAPSPEDRDGGEDMARASTTREERETQSKRGNDEVERSSGNATASEPRSRPQDGRDNRSQDRVPRRGDGVHGYHFDAIAASRAELIRLAATWSDAGAPFQAIRIYTQVLERYPNSGAAVAAVDGLLNLARRLQQQGMYFTAAGILEKLYYYS